MEDIDYSTSDGEMLRAVRILKRRKFDGIEDIHKNSQDEIHMIVTEHIKEKYRDEKIKDINVFTGQARLLLYLIIKKESVKQR